ncbi:interferon-inducible GTPase 5-like [Brachionus plicatilis]|uniref:Interferon-inducible GTPase 5-like n=1 Tax=Brachionus plicatilis TaxID=10195 RepID=A0A3M7Q8Z9_BRAPC|nr:interferon-inducible GTPase 5-like [Brachionus plicatilis]
MNNFLFQNLQSVLDCSICLETYSSPTNVPLSLPDCKHLLCKKCCETLLNNRLLKCPICKRDNKIKDINSIKDASPQVLSEFRSIFENKTNVEYKNKNTSNGNEINYSQISNEVKDLTGINELIKKIKEKKENWKNIAIRIAFLGKSRVGKSTLINTIRGLAPKRNSNEEQDLAKVDVIQCTAAVKGYKFKDDEKILLCDVPGLGTPEYRQNTDYLKKIDFHSYDYFVLLTNETFFECDEWLLKNIVQTGKPFAFVYTKIDSVLLSHIESFSDFQDWSKEDKDTEEAKKISVIRKDCEDSIKKIIQNKPFKLYMLSGHFNKRDKYEYKEFYESLYKYLPKMKKDMMNLILKPISDNLILTKDNLVNSLIDKFKAHFTVYTAIKENEQNNEQANPIEEIEKFSEYVKGKISLSTSDQLSLIAKACEFLRMAIDDFQEASVMILSIEFKSLF